MKKKIALSLLALVFGIGGIAALAATESQIVSVTAKISEGIGINVKSIDFGTVAPLSKTDKTLTISLSESATDDEDEVDDINQVVTCSTANLIKNGSFETPKVTNSAKWDVFPSGTAGLEWTVKWESSVTTFEGKTRPSTALLELQAGVNGWLAQEGTQYAELDTAWGGPNSGMPSNAPSLVRISQDIPTVKGNTYKLSYYFSPRPGTDASENVLTVKINGQTVQTETASGIGKTQTNWMLFEKEFVATGSTTKVEFIGGGTPDGLGTFVDNVKIVATKCEKEEEEEGEEIHYTIQQKPSCVKSTDPDNRTPVMQNDDEFKCPTGYKMMPVLCPYLSKTQSDKDEDTKSIPAFHGSVSDWDVNDTLKFQAKGALDDEDEKDTWIIDLEAPCIKGSCPSNFSHKGFELSQSLVNKPLGCDLWINVSGESDVNVGL